MEPHEIANDPELKSLFRDLGREIQAQQFGFSPADDDELEKEGRRFWKWNGDDIHAKLCTDSFVSRHTNSPELELITAITDALVGFPYTTIVRIVIRVGLVRFCGR